MIHRVVTIGVIASLLLANWQLAAEPVRAAADAIEIHVVDGRTGMPLGYACYSIADRTLGGPFVVGTQCDLDGDGVILTEPLPHPTDTFEVGQNQTIPAGYLAAPLQTTSGGGAVTMVHQPKPRLIIATVVGSLQSAALSGHVAAERSTAGGRNRNQNAAPIRSEHHKKPKKRHRHANPNPTTPQPQSPPPTGGPALPGACYLFADAVRSRGTFTVCDGSPQDADGANDGVVTTAPLDPSTYHVTQSKAPSGYQLASGTQDVVASPGLDAHLTIVNRPA